MTNVVIAGEYLVGFTGDEAMLCSMLMNLGRRLPGARFVVLSRIMFQPLHGETDSDIIARRTKQMEKAGELLKPFLPARTSIAMTTSHWSAISEADVVVVGGGNLLTDINDYPPHAPLTYYSTVTDVANACGVPVVGAGLGIGPLSRRWGYRMVGQFARRCDHLFLRDTESISYLERCGMTMAVPCPDLAMGLPHPDKQDDKDMLAVSPRWYDGAKEWIPELTEAIARIAEMTELTPLGVPHSRYGVIAQEDDANVCATVTPEGSPVITDSRIENPLTLLNVYAGVRAALTVRLHGAVLSTKARTPFLALEYLSKVKGFCEQAQAPSVPITSSADVIVDAFMTMWHDRQALTQTLDARASEMEAALDDVWDTIAELATSRRNLWANCYRKSTQPPEKAA